MPRGADSFCARHVRLCLAAFLTPACASPSPPGVARPEPAVVARPGAAKPPLPRDEPPEGSIVVSIASLAPLAPGEHGEAEIVIQLAEGVHITSDRPSRPEYVATRVELGTFQSSDVATGEPVYPDAVPFTVGDETLSTFVGTVVVRVPIEVSRDAPAGVRNIPGKVRFQACTSGRCLYPKTLPIRAVIEVKGD